MMWLIAGPPAIRDVDPDMKHDGLRSIAHNIADSLASGCGLMVGVYDVDVFAEAGRSAAGFVEIDYLNGTNIGGPVSEALANAILLYKRALPGLCERHSASLSAFTQLIARYDGDPLSRRFSVTVTDSEGRSSVTEYRGVLSQRAKHIDQQGRLRPKQIIRTKRF